MIALFPIKTTRVGHLVRSLMRCLRILFVAAPCLGTAEVVSALDCRRTEPVGAPALPEEIELVEIPPGSVCTGVTFSVQAWRPRADIGIPSPIQQPRRGDDRVAWTDPDLSYYGQEIWPKAPVELAGAFKVEGRLMQRVRISRQRWRGALWQSAATGVVEIATGLSFTPLLTRRPTASLASAASVETGVGKNELLILSPPDLREAWNDYADLRRGRLPAWDVRVIGTDEIYRDHPFGAGLPNRNAAESIHAYLRAVARSGRTHVLLGGMWIDAAKEVPERYFLTGEQLSLSNCVPGIEAYPCVDDRCGTVPSDLFYACLDGNVDGAAYPWDPDGDGVYLSESEVKSCDVVADVVVGRFAPVPYESGSATLLTPARMIDVYAAKVARGTGASFAGSRCLGLASDRMQTTVPRSSTSLGRPHREQTFFDGVPNVWDLMHPESVSDGEWMTRETLRTMIAPHWPILDVESLHAGQSLKASRYSSWTEAREAFGARDLIYAICRSHGSETSVAGGNLTRDFYAHATGLALFNEFSVPCLAGALSCTRIREGRVYVLPSLGMAATAATEGGALAGIYNAGYGWYDAFGGMTLSDGYSSTIGYLTAKNLFQERDATLGLAVCHAHQQYAAQYSPKGIKLFLLCEQFFYGDPSLGLPDVERDAELVAATVVAENRAVVSARTAAPEVAVAGNARFQVMDGLSSSGTNAVLASGGGVGGRVAFTGKTGRLELAGAEPFYVGGVSNCSEVVLSGSGKMLDATGAGTVLRMFSSEGAGTNVLRCTTTGGLALMEPIRVENGWLRLETAEAFDSGSSPVAAVTNGGLLWAASPLAGWDGDTEHLARPVWLKDAVLQTEGRRRVCWGRHTGSSWRSFALHVAGTSTVSIATRDGVPFGLVGTTTVEVEDGGVLEIASPLENMDAGRLLFTGTGRVVVRRADALAGDVEVRDGATLALGEIPLPVTSLVVRAGATLRLPASASGRHDVVAGPGFLQIEEGGIVEDGAGTRLTGIVVDGSYFEPASTLRWKGGAGVWSDPEGWYDAVTGTYGPWTHGRTAIFDAREGSMVSNDLVLVSTPSLIFSTGASLTGNRLRLETGTFTVPTNVAATIAAPLEVAGGIVKYGAGELRLVGDQSGLSMGGLRVAEGRLGLQNVTAPGMTNLVAVARTCLEIEGRNFFTNAAACATLATNALACTAPDAMLVLEDFRPLSGMVVPENLEVVVAPRTQKGYAAWNLALEGRIDYRGTLSLLYGRIGGPGTIRVAGLRSQSTYGATFGACRLELAGGNGVFPVFEDLSWGRGVFVFDGTTFSPTGSLVVSSAVCPSSQTILYVDEGGVVFDVPAGAELVFGDANPTYLFGGDGGLVKRGAGSLRFTTVADQHEGPTIVERGTYALGTWTTLRDLRVDAGATVDLSDPYPTGIVLTNLVLAAGSRLELGVSDEGSDILDVREGTLRLPSNGVARIAVTIDADTRPGIYGLLLSGNFPWETASLEFSSRAPAGHQAFFRRTAQGLLVQIRPAATTLFLR